MSDLIRTRISLLRSRAHGAELGRGVGRLVSVLVIGLLAWLVVDYWFVSQVFGAGAWDILARLAMTAGLLGLAGREAWSGLIAEIRRQRHDDELAMRLEQTYPELAGRLISTVQLLRELHHGDASRVASPGLVEALAEETEERTREVDYRRAWDRSPARKALLTGGALIVLAGGLAAWRSDIAAAFFGRLCFLAAHYPTATRILTVTVPAMVGRGDPAVIEVRVDPASEVPAYVDAVVRGADGRTGNIRLERLPTEGEACFRGSIKQAVEDVSVRPQAGDHRWEAWEEIRVIARPVVRKLTLTSAYPAYLRMPSAQVAIGDLEIPAGSQVEVQAEASRPVVEAALGLAVGAADPEPMAMTLSPDGSTALARFTVLENGAWSINFKASDGIDTANPPRWTITAVPDAAPVVVANFPARERNVTRIARWPIRFTARDDHGVSGVRLRWQVVPPGVEPESATGEPGSQEISGMATVGAESISGETWFDLSPLNLEIGSRVQWWLEVRDHRTPAANVGESHKGTFTVVDPAEERERMLRVKADLLNTVRDHLKIQKDIRDGVQGVQKAVDSPPATPKPAPKPSSPKPK